MTSSARVLIVGLGNLSHPLTRHRPVLFPSTVGQLVLDSLATRLGARLSADKDKIDINDRPFNVALYKTHAPMNLSGPPVLMALRKTVRAAPYMIVLHDSIEHKPTTVSQKFGRSGNGHNGVRRFFRLRLGIGRPDSPESDVADYVLSRLPNFERQYWAPDGPGLDLVLEQIQRIGAPP
ncbi:peptidyl-tRNA hydrolase [Russula vinacea]|nr:peptidyl-tRNA hydrolase [Russula vinacea]